MTTRIQLKLYATLRTFMPAAGEDFPIRSGTSVRELLRKLGLPESQAKLIFIDGIQSRLEDTLQGGERVGIFPPVGGG
jgi:molybdopterin converting factor small subunit